MQKLTPLPEWCELVGLNYQRGWRLASRGEINVTRLGSRYYVLGNGLGGDNDAASSSPPSRPVVDEGAQQTDEE